jgi:hypothetical protein
VALFWCWGVEKLVIVREVERLVSVMMVVHFRYLRSMVMAQERSDQVVILRLLVEIVEIVLMFVVVCSLLTLV